MLEFEKDKYGAINVIDSCGDNVGFFVYVVSSWMLIMLDDVDISFEMSEIIQLSDKIKELTREA